MSSYRFKWWLSDNLSNIVLVLSLVISLLIMAAVGAQSMVTTMDNSICLAHGYREAKITMDFKGYCIKTVNQTDVVVPIGELNGR